MTMSNNGHGIGDFKLVVGTARNGDSMYFR